MENGIYSCLSTWTSPAPFAFTNTGSVLKTPSDMYPSGRQTTLVCTDTIDFSAYTKVKAVTNQGTVEADVTSINQSAYLAILVRNNGGGRYFNIAITTNKQNFLEQSYILGGIQHTLTATDTSTTFSISEITVE